jgi:hypothetical protein
MKKSAFAAFKERMAEKGKVITLPKDSPLRDLLGIPYPQEEVEPSNDKEE